MKSSEMMLENFSGQAQGRDSLASQFLPDFDTGFGKLRNLQFRFSCGCLTLWASSQEVKKSIAVNMGNSSQPGMKTQ
ncbi:MAG: hypothetical protein AB2L12_07715 [Smithellaceae bacterium]